jgi:hypothetical protein
VGFYNLDGELLAWRIAFEDLGQPMALSMSDYYQDKNGRSIYKGLDNAVASPWPAALNGLFWKDGLLIVGGKLKECASEDQVIIVPDGVKTICPLALEEPDAIEVYLPEGVLALLASDCYGSALNAFYALAQIELPDSLIRMDEGCLDCDVENVTVVCREGSFAETYAQEHGMNVAYR